MFTRIVTISLIFGLSLFGSLNTVYSQTNPEVDKNTKKINKIRNGIKKLGTGEDAKIKVKLLDKTKVKGYVDSAGEDDFTIIEKGTGNSRTLKYSEIRSVSGKNIPLGVKIAIGVGIAILATIIIFEIVFHTVIDN